MTNKEYKKVWTIKGLIHDQGLEYGWCSDFENALRAVHYEYVRTGEQVLGEMIYVLEQLANTRVSNMGVFMPSNKEVLYALSGFNGQKDFHLEWEDTWGTNPTEYHRIDLEGDDYDEYDEVTIGADIIQFPIV